MEGGKESIKKLPKNGAEKNKTNDIQDRLSDTQAVLSVNGVIYAIIYYINDKPNICNIGLSYKSTNSEYRDRIIQYYNIKKIKPSIEHNVPLSIQINSNKSADYKTKIKKELISDAIAEKCYFLAFNWAELRTSISRESFMTLVGKPYYSESNFEPSDAQPSHLLIDLYSDRSSYTDQPYGQHIQFTLPMTPDIIKSASAYYDNYKAGKFNDKLQTYVPSPNYDDDMSRASMILIPLNARTVNKVDISSRQWLELVIFQVVDIMAREQLCPGLPKFGGYMIISANSVNLFDHITSVFDISSNVVRSIMRSAHNTIHCNVTVPINVFDNSLLSSRDFAEEFIILSNYALGVFTEYKGTVISDLNKISLSQFKKLTFEYLYTLATLNEIGIIHGDVFINNLTVQTAPKQYTYNIGDRTYKFDKSDNLYGSIIDFNSAIININSAIFQTHMPETPADIHHYRINIEYRVSRILKISHKTLISPIINYMQSANLSDLENVFWILVGIDVFNLISSLSHLKFLDEQCTKWITTIHQDIDETLKKQLMRLILPIPHNNIAADLIAKYFFEFAYDKASNNKIDFMYKDVNDKIKKIKLPAFSFTD